MSWLAGPISGLTLFYLLFCYLTIDDPVFLCLNGFTPLFGQGMVFSPTTRVGWGFLALQPAFERGCHFAKDASIQLTRGFADEFVELHRLDALDVDIALLSQPRHAGQGDLVRCVLKLFGDQNHAGQCQSGIDLSR